MIRISIIEDSEIHREWLKVVLSDMTQFQIVSEDVLGRNGIESVKSSHPDLVILDFQLEDMTGLEVSKRIKSYDNTIKIFILTAHSDAAIIERMMMDKTIDAIAVKGSRYLETNFISAIKNIVEGGYYIEPSILDKLRESKHSSLLSDLTKREFEVFIQLCTKKSEQLIANDLCVELSHVRNLKSMIMRKTKHLNLNNLVSRLVENVKYS